MLTRREDCWDLMSGEGQSEAGRLVHWEDGGNISSLLSSACISSAFCTGRLHEALVASRSSFG